MKISLFNQAGKDEKSEEEKNENKPQKTAIKRFENSLIYIGFSVLFIMIAAQAAMVYPGIRTAFFYEQMEGNPLSAEVFLFVPCKMELSLTNMGQCLDMKVMVNGEERDSFREKSLLLDLKDGDVVQLDGTNVPVLAQVQISAVSRNISGLLGKTVVVTEGIITVANISVSELKS